ncbi:type VI secretion system protein ImpF [Methylobacterium sp. OAE515]|uniref:type VI secretion system baseplate subunit TssE n=1 Tax=Methylobacterium sp. OAE515 TaxID=2817895 RepID=UPI00178BF91F
MSTRRGESLPKARASVLDRLLDDRPDRPRDPPCSASETVAQARHAVHRDIENLLNARRPWRSLPWPTLANSPLGYGISDFTAGTFNDAAEQERLRRDVEETIRRFEPRLAQVQVRLAEVPTALRAVLRLRIDALLLIDPMPEPIGFDTLIDTSAADVVLRPTHVG